MDPNSALELILSAIAAGRWDEDTAIATEGLQSWIARGGALPDRLRGIVADVRGDAYEHYARTPEPFDCDDDEVLDFRLYIRPDGAMDTGIGDASFDTDHRGYCGAGSIARYDRKDDIAAAIVDAFFEVVSDFAEYGPELTY